MKRNGILAFVIYLIGTIFAGLLAIYAYIEAQKIPEGDDSSWVGLGAALLLIFAIIIGIPSAARLVAKILQMATGLKLFGILCMLGDAAVFGYFIVSIFTEATTPELILREWPTMLIVGVPNALAFISNARSITD